MAATVTLTVNVEQAKAALNQVNSAITQIKLNGSQITIGGQKVATDMDGVAKSTEKLAQATSKVGNEATKADKGLKGLFKGATKEGKEAIRGIKDFANGLFSVWSAIIIAVELAAKTFTYFWNNLTESIDKLTTRGQTAIKVAQRQQQQADKQADSAKSLIKQLEDLNKQESLNIYQQRLADSILAKLNKQYKNLGITLDETTGKYNGLYQAEMKIDAMRRRSQANALQKEIAAQRDVANAALVKTFGRGIQLDKQVNGKDFFSLAEALGGTMGYQNSNLLAQKWNTGDLQKQIEVIEQLIGGLSSSEQVIQNSPEALAALQTLKDYKDQLKELNSVENLVNEASKRLADSFKPQKDAIEQTRKAIEQLNKSYEAQQRANSLAQLDPEDRANAIRAEIEQLQKRNDELLKAQEIGQKQLSKKQADSAFDLIDFDYLGDKLEEYSKKVEKTQDQIAKKRQNASRLIEKANSIQTWEAVAGVAMEIPGAVEKQNALQQEALDELNSITQLQKQLVSDQKILNQLKGEFKKQEAQYQASQSDILKTQQAISDLEKQRAENMNELQEKSNELKEIEEQIAELRRQAEEAEQKRIDDYNDYVASLYRKEQDALNDIIGKKKQSLLLEAKLNAEKIRGRELTEDELQSLRDYVDINEMIGQLKNGSKLNLDRNGVITNDLARKGGWASSVVVDRAEDINRQILGVQKTQVDLMHKINDTMSKSNDLLKQFSVIQ